MVVKRVLVKKVLSNGDLAEVSLVRRDDAYCAALFLNGKHVPGPTAPQPLPAPKGEATHWMGGRPSVGLTYAEAEKVTRAIDIENDSLDFQNKKNGI